MNTLRRQDNDKIPPCVALLMAVGVYAKEFYIGNSGSLQIGDMCFLAAFLLIILLNKMRMTIYRIDVWLIAFITLSATINCVYAIYYSDMTFVMFSSYLIYSLFVVFLTREVSNDKSTLQSVSFALKAAMITQVFVSLSGMGRHLYGRYTGTFNDPNQYGYFVLTSLFLTKIIDEKLEHRSSIVWTIIPIYLIALSQSSGMFLGLSVYLFLSIWNGSFLADQTSKRKQILRFLIIVSFILILFILIGGNFRFLEQIKISGFQRLVDRLFGSKTSGSGNFLMSFITDRSITRILRNPWGLLYGTGEGRWQRYPEGNEIHSTMISICYYYGIVPYIIWLTWIKKNIENISKKMVCVYCALIIEAFTLGNHRQPFFWMLLVLAYNPDRKNEKIRNNVSRERLIV